MILPYNTQSGKNSVSGRPHNPPLSISSFLVLINHLAGCVADEFQSKSQPILHGDRMLEYHLKMTLGKKKPLALNYLLPDNFPDESQDKRL